MSEATRTPEQELAALDERRAALHAQLAEVDTVSLKLRQAIERRGKPTFSCPRRAENPGPWKLPTEDVWRDDISCSYCGSLRPDVLMARLEAETISLEPTDKHYKIYYQNRGGEEISVRGARKFYFQHLDKAQRMRFVELLNAGKLHLEYPGRFYVLPFFIEVTP